MKDNNSCEADLDFHYAFRWVKDLPKFYYPKIYFSQFAPDINGCIETSEVISILKQLNTKPTILESELAEFEQVSYDHLRSPLKFNEKYAIELRMCP